MLLESADASTPGLAARAGLLQSRAPAEQLSERGAGQRGSSCYAASRGDAPRPRSRRTDRRRGLRVRVYPAWNGVFGATGVNFLETDAWYHVRLVENQVRNFPWRVTLDPYAARERAVRADRAALRHDDRDGGRARSRPRCRRPSRSSASPRSCRRSSARSRSSRVWALGRGLLRSACGPACGGRVARGVARPFLDRTMLGFVDHHALEALLATVTLLALMRGAIQPSTGEWRRRWHRARLVSAHLGSGAFLSRSSPSGCWFRFRSRAR